MNCKINITCLDVSHQRGFTLLELMGVMAILSVMVGLAIVTYGDVEEQTKLSIARSEMKEIQQAILQFKRDTGYFPGQGPFRLTGNVPNGATPFRDPYIHTSELPAQVTSDQAEWFASAANLWLLFGTGGQSPLYQVNHPLEFYSNDTRRGWRGPYLNSIDENEAVISGDFLTSITELNPYKIDSSGNIVNPLPSMPVVYDPWGRPYLFFLNGTPTNSAIQLISLGPDGLYDNGGFPGDDIILEIPN